MESTRDSLRPFAAHRIIDLVAETGIDVSDWANTNARSASVNPKYCYEWVFRDAQTISVCLWFSEIVAQPDGLLSYRLNPRGYAEALRGQKGRGNVARRARLLDAALRDAHAAGQPLRVIVVDGEQVDLEKETRRSSIVKKRLLDPVPWHVAEYEDASGMTLLLRCPPGPRYLDQFDLPTPTGEDDPLRQRLVNVRDRSAAVRQSALQRAAGACEYCGCAGFPMANGGVYLETHHVVPLHEEGPDTVGNVAALCPNHHREAHHGTERDLIRAHLKAMLGRVLGA